MSRIALKHPFVFIFGIIFPLALYAIFIGYPLVNVTYLSLTSWDGIEMTKEFVGIENYTNLIQDPNFRLSLSNNFKWALVTLLFPVVIGLLLAVVLQSGKIFFSNGFRAIIFLPSTMPLVMVGIMFAMILNPVFGAMNKTLNALGLSFLIQDWLGDPKIALYTLIGVFSWSYIGLPMILYYAGISEIPQELFEAAQIEGANGFQVLRFVTFPMLLPVTTVVTMLTAINSLRAFDLVMIMTRGGPFRQTSVLGYFMYTETFWNYRFGYGAAISVAILLLSAIFTAIYLRSIAGETLRANQ